MPEGILNEDVMEAAVNAATDTGIGTGTAFACGFVAGGILACAANLVISGVKKRKLAQDVSEEHFQEDVVTVNNMDDENK